MIFENHIDYINYILYNIVNLNQASIVISYFEGFSNDFVFLKVIKVNLENEVQTFYF